MKDTHALRSHAVLSLLIALYGACAMIYTGNKVTLLAYSMTALLMPLIMVMMVLMLMVIIGLVKNGPHGKMPVSIGVTESYIALIIGSGIAIAAIPAWKAGLALPAILVFVLALIVTNIVSVMAFCWHDGGEGVWWTKRHYWKLSILHGITPMMVITATAYFGSGGALPTLQSRVADVIIPVLILGMFITQFAFAWTLERPFAQENKKPDLHVVNRAA